MHYQDCEQKSSGFIPLTPSCAKVNPLTICVYVPTLLNCYNQNLVKFGLSSLAVFNQEILQQNIFYHQCSIWLFIIIPPLLTAIFACICENKDTDQLRGNREADHAFVFATRIVHFLSHLNPKFQASSSFL